MRIEKLVWGVAVAMLTQPFASAAETPADVNRMQRELRQLQRQVEAQAIALRAFADRVDELEGNKTVSQSSPQKGRYIRVAEEGRTETAPQQTSEPKAEEAVVKQAKPSRSVENVLQEEHTLFNRRFTLETGLTYSHFSRKQLMLNGFLALDAIFLGSLSVDEVDADVLTLDLTGRYGLTDRLQFDLNAPFLYRHTNYISGGVGGSAVALSEESVTLTPRLGDVNMGLYYQLLAETTDWPDVVWNVRVKAPTGSDPYGVDVITDPNNDNLSYPEELPSGNGLWSVSTGFSFVKTVDPAILFASVAYFHNFDRHFSDLDTDPETITPGRIDLGDSFQFGLGMAFALNERLSMSMSYNQRFTFKSRRQYDGEDWLDIVGSSANAATLNLGLTYAFNKQLSMIASLGAGLTPDASDMVFSVKFPYAF